MCLESYERSVKIMAKEEKNPLAEALAEFNNYEEPKVITLKSKVLNGILNGGLPEGSVIQFAEGQEQENLQLH